jgi:sulfur-oxidizing protein SoxY
MGVTAMPRLARRPLLLGALAIGGGARAQGIEPENAPRRAERWRDLKGAIFGDRATRPAGDGIELVAPARALDAAAVPVSLSLAPALVGQVRAIWIVVDENPAPLAAVFRAGPAGDLRALSLRLRVDAYTHLHAVAETRDGALLEAARFVKRRAAARRRSAATCRRRAPGWGACASRCRRARPRRAAPCPCRWR